jgi:hypothetical protein
LDNRVKTYAITTRVRKWYWAIYTWFLGVSMVQAWRLFRLHKREESVSEDQPKRTVEQQRAARIQVSRVADPDSIGSMDLDPGGQK